MDEFTIVIDGVPYVVKGDAAAKAAIRMRLGRVTELERDLERTQARADQAETERDQAKTERDQATDPVKLDARVTARAELCDRARKVAGKADLDTSGSDREVMTRALDARGIKGLEERSDDYVAARFDAASESAPAAPNRTVNAVVDSIGSRQPAGKRRFQRLHDARQRAMQGGE